jgi:hydrogenase maturation protease
MSDSPGTLVIGLGNPLMGDDGFGLAVLAELRERWRMPDDVELVDGGTWGIRLLPLLDQAGRVLFLDAVDRGAEPGTPFVLQGDELPRALCLKLSPHQIDLREVLALAAFRGSMPAEVAAVGAQPADVQMRHGLSPALERRVPDVAGLAVQTLEAWGHAVGASD